MLLAWNQGDQAALDHLVPVVHGELRRLAQRHMRRERPDHTLQATALVNEVYVRLVGGEPVHWRDRAHFFAMSARIMRRILVDHARSRRSLKRGGGASNIAFDEALTVAQKPGHDLVALDDALEALAAVDVRRSRVVELRYFGGLTVDETAVVLDVSSDTILRDWRLAKAWLRRELSTR